MVDTNIYGWTYTDFNTFIGWDVGNQAKYEAWENLWSRKVDAYIFTDIDTTPRITDANEVLQVGDIVNEMMVLTNLYLKGESAESPMELGFYDAPGFPQFKGNPNANGGKGTIHYRLLNRLNKKYSAPNRIRTDAVRLTKTKYY